MQKLRPNVNPSLLPSSPHSRTVNPLQTRSSLRLCLHHRPLSSNLSHVTTTSLSLSLLPIPPTCETPLHINILPRQMTLLHPSYSHLLTPSLCRRSTQGSIRHLQPYPFTRLHLHHPPPQTSYHTPPPSTYTQTFLPWKISLTTMNYATTLTNN